MNTARLNIDLTAQTLPTRVFPLPHLPGEVGLSLGCDVEVTFFGTPAQIREQVIDALSNQLGAYEDTLRERGMGFADVFADDEPVAAAI